MLLFTAIWYLLSLTSQPFTPASHKLRQERFYIFDRHSQLDPPTHFLLDILDNVLEKNYFRMEDQFYFQIQGIALGSVCAPSIANLFIQHFEETYIFANTNPFFDNIILFKRYIDDVFLLFNDSSKIQAFFIWLNQLHTSIKFVGKFDIVTLNVLDPLVCME